MTEPCHPLQETVAALPLCPGVYRFLDGNQRVLYVGKAKSLKKRVSSYFVGRGDTRSARIQAMLNRARNLEVTVTTTENEALILEANLIKRFQPPYNVLLKDDKSHPYLHLSTDHAYPRLTLRRISRRGMDGARVTTTSDTASDALIPTPVTRSGRFFGPFPSVSAVRETLKWLQRLFPIRKCEDNAFKQRQRPCLQYQIKRCSAPCCSRISAAGYAGLVRDVSLFLEGKEKVLLELLKKSMWEAAENRAFEEAAQLRDRIKAISLVQDQRRVNLSETCHLDVFGVAQDAGGFVVQVFFVRHGINLGNSHFFPENSDGLTPEEMLDAFLSQYYATKDYVAKDFNEWSSTTETTVSPSSSEKPDPSALTHLPEEILVSHVLGQRRWLAAALSRLRKGQVRIHKPTRGEKLRLLNMALLNAEQVLESRRQSRRTFDRLLHELAEVLALPVPLKRIEAYDVSHFQDSHPVGSLIVFGPEGWKKKAYRHFTLQDPELLDDTARMARMLSRRFARLMPKEAIQDQSLEEKMREEGTWPDLILLDGGRGQLNAVLEVSKALPCHGLRFCAIAKGLDRHAGQEQLFLPDREQSITLPLRSPVLFLLQNIRDEAHRFAVGLHRVQRGRAQTQSVIDQIPGVGAQRKRALLRHFGSVKALRKASVADLLSVAGVSEALAHRVVQFFQEDL